MKRILVIEDDYPVRENIVELLTAEGYDVVDAADGAEGVRAAWEKAPDLIICDVMMPRLDGFDTLTLLARDERTQSIPFIFLTARISREDQRRGMATGADDYITKPFTRSELLSAIQARLSKRADLDGHAQRRLSSLQRTSSAMLPRPLLNHLSVILGFSDLLEQDYRTLERGQVLEIARDINHSANQLLRWVQNRWLYMELTRQLHSDAAPLKQPGAFTYAAHRVIEESAREKASQYRRSGDLTVKVEPAAAAVSDVYLKKMVEEVIDNAFRYSMSGTPVSLLGEVLERGLNYRLTITDSGRGMLPELAEKAGLPLPAHIEESARGNYGMGLMLVRSIAEGYGGKLALTSALGEGATVTITLPCATERQPEPD